MRQLIDQVRGKTPTSAVLLASRSGRRQSDAGGRHQQGPASTQAQRRRLDSPGGRGRGRRRRRSARLAQAGGKNPAKLPEALEIAKITIRDHARGMTRTAAVESGLAFRCVAFARLNLPQAYTVVAGVAVCAI